MGEERADVVKLASKRDYERGQKNLRKATAFGDPAMIERAKRQLAMEEQAQLTIARSLTKSAKFFVNYNQVETVFLGSAIYVCLAGIMFASGYFENEYYEAQGAVLRIVSLIAICLSIFYFFFIVAREIRGVVLYRREKNKAKWSAFKQKANFHKDLFQLDNANATETEKNAASKIGAAFMGKKARKDLHEKIQAEGTAEEKEKLARMEKNRRMKGRRSSRRRSRSRSRRQRPNETPEERAARKERQAKRKQARLKKREEERKRRRENGDGNETERRHAREGKVVPQASAKDEKK